MAVLTLCLTASISHMMPPDVLCIKLSVTLGRDIKSTTYSIKFTHRKYYAVLEFYTLVKTVSACLIVVLKPCFPKKRETEMFENHLNSMFN